MIPKNSLCRIKVGLYRCLSLAVLTAACLAPISSAPATNAPGIVHAIDFTDKPCGEASEWLREHGYNFRMNAEGLDLHFDKRGLVLATDRRIAGLLERALRLSNVGRIRITWGVEDYPEGANWENGVYRLPIAVMVSFGDKKIGSGNLFVPNTPYFIGLFLSRNAQPGKAYTGNYYTKGGRYFCQPCSPPEGETVTTEFDLAGAFRNQFDKSVVPPVTSFGIQMNTNDTRGGARAYLQRIEFLEH